MHLKKPLGRKNCGVRVACRVGFPTMNTINLSSFMKHFGRGSKRLSTPATLWVE